MIVNFYAKMWDVGQTTVLRNPVITSSRCLLLDPKINHMFFSDMTLNRRYTVVLTPWPKYVDVQNLQYNVSGGSPTKYIYRTLESDDDANFH